MIDYEFGEPNFVDAIGDDSEAGVDDEFEDLVVGGGSDGDVEPNCASELDREHLRSYNFVTRDAAAYLRVNYLL